MTLKTSSSGRSRPKGVDEASQAKWVMWIWIWRKTKEERPKGLEVEGAREGHFQEVASKALRPRGEGVVVGENEEAEGKEGDKRERFWWATYFFPGVCVASLVRPHRLMLASISSTSSPIMSTSWWPERVVSVGETREKSAREDEKVKGSRRPPVTTVVMAAWRWRRTPSQTSQT